MATNFVRKMIGDSYTPTLTEKQVLYYRTHPEKACEDLLGIKLIWLQRITLRMIWFKRFPLLNMGRGVGKSYIIAIAALLFAILYPRTKIGIVAPVFRQANYVFDAIDEIYNNSEYLQSACTRPPSRGSAQSILRMHNSSFIEALPVGDGTKIRGRRYHVAFIDEYAQMDELIIKLVIRPMLNIKRKTRQNKLAIASTAYYRWNHYWTLYLFYIKQILNGHPDYGIAEFDYIDVNNTPNSPYEVDMEIIEMQKNDMTQEEFDMENRCCTGDTYITTDSGMKFIKDVNVGDKVLTHKGNFRKVTEVFSKEYRGLINKLSFRYSRDALNVTPNHPIYSDSGWVLSDKVGKDFNGFIPAYCVKELTKEYLLVSDYVDGIVHSDGTFSSHLNRNLTQEQYDGIRGATKGKWGCFKKVQKKLGITKHQWGYHSKRERIPNIAVNNQVKIDDRFMSLVGWYMAEGSADSSLRFDFNSNETSYMKEVQLLINSVFSVKAGLKTKGSNGAVVVHNKNIVRFFKNVFGTSSHSKKLPTWFFSLEPGLLKEFIRSIWLGDGYHTSSIGCELSNSLLIDQIRQVLLRLGIMSSVKHRLKPRKYNIIGKQGFTKGVSKVTVSGHSARKLLEILEYPVKKSKWYRNNLNYKINGNGALFPLDDKSQYWYEGKIYNLEVEEDHSYVANNVAVHNCVFPADSVSFIPARLVDQCTPKMPEPLQPELMQPAEQNRAEYVLGVDCARVAGGDNFAIQLLKLADGKKKQIFCLSKNGIPYPEMASVVRDLLMDFNILRIHIGAGGGGLTLKDLLAEKWKNRDGEEMPPLLDMDDPDHEAKEGLRLIRLVNESQRKNNELYMNLKSEMQHKRMQFPADVRSFSQKEPKSMQAVYGEVLATKRELMVLEAIPSGMYHKFTVPSKYKKDRATALVMAVDAALELGRVDKVDRDGELATGLWV